MTDQLPERDLLRTIDPAPVTVDEADQIRNLQRVIERSATSGRRWWAPRHLWVRIALPLGLAAAAACGALVLSLPQADSLLPGLTAHQPADDQPTAIRAGSTTQAGVRILANATVGTAQFLLGQNGDDIRFGASFDGSDPDENWSTFGDAQTVADDDITLVNVMNFPSAIPGGAATVAGQVGSAVTGLSIRTDAGGTVEAEVVDGYYVAAWEGMDFWDRDTLDAVFTLHLADGSMRTVSYWEMTE
jgi:hypothetical protein